MEGTNYTPVDQTRLELLWRKKGNNLKMELAFGAIGILTILVATIILVILVNKSKQTQQPQTPKKSVPSPSIIPTDMPQPTEETLMPDVSGQNNDLESANTNNTDASASAGM